MTQPPRRPLLTQHRLAAALAALEAEGLVERRPGPGGPGFHLTARGRQERRGLPGPWAEGTA